MKTRGNHKNKLWQKKSLGQVFLQTKAPIEKVVTQLEHWKVRRVLEIGAGDGALTLSLVEANLQVTSLEKDQRFYEQLSIKPEAQADNLSLICADVMEFDFNEWLDSDEGVCAIVGNIPYNLSSAILTKTIDSLSDLAGAIFLTQLEFANRIISDSGNKTYGSLSVFTQLRADTNLLCMVPKEDFFPVPKVDSALFSLTPRADLDLTDKQLRKVEVLCRAAFAQRRKKLRNTLKSFMGQLDLEQSPVDLELRPERLTPAEFISLAEFCFPSEF